MLVVVVNGNLERLLELAFDLEAAGSRDVLQMDGTEAALQQLDGVHDLVDVLATDAQGKRVDIGKCLE